MEKMENTYFNVLWISHADRIASFHPVANYNEQRFTSHDHFISYICSLQERGYRFQ